MKTRSMALLAGTAVALLAMAAPAVAHVTVQPNEAPVGSFFRFVVRVPNERDDASTNKVQVQLPPLPAVRFEDAPGWQRKVEMVTLDEPLELFGEEITEVPGTVTWSGGEVEPNEFAEFGFSARMPEDVTTLEFPAIQTYDSGEVVRWIGPPDSEEPAALVSTVDLGLEEGQGPLAVISQLRAEVQRLRTESGGSGDDSDNPGTALGLAGIGVGVVALAVAMRRKRA